MNRKIPLALAAAVVSFATFTSSVLAAGTAHDAHAFLESERARTEGGGVYRPAAGVTTVAGYTAADKWFASERARREGQSDPVRIAPNEGNPIRSAVDSRLEMERTRSDG